MKYNHAMRSLLRSKEIKEGPKISLLKRTRCWCQHGFNQSKDTYWKRIHDYFHSKKDFESDRTQSSLMSRWSSILHDCNIFAGCVSKVEARNQSGASVDDKVR